MGTKVQIFSMQVAFFFLVRFYPYLLAGGLRFPSVDIDGYPVGAAHCQNTSFGNDSLNIRHG